MTFTKTKKTTGGFSTLELMIAFALMSIVLVGAVGANFAAQYWRMNSQTANEGLYKAKTKLEDMRSLIKQDFYQVLSTPLTKSVDPTDPADTACIQGGLCYFVQTTVSDISSCSKYVEAKVQWQVQNYPETTTSLFTNLTNSSEVIATGGDCALNTPNGDWENNSPQNVGSLSFGTGKQFTDIDVLHKKIYTTSRTFPSFVVYKTPDTVGQNPTQIGSYDLKMLGFSLKLNAVDVLEDFGTGRTYAFAAVATTTGQLVVFDVTDGANPSFVAQRTLQNVNSTGLYPEGWKIFIYGGRLYITTRETSGHEFHIFDISTPTIPTEIGNGYELNRTVNAIVVRDQKIAGVKRRLVFLAEDAGALPYSNQLKVLDVTGDVISELNFVTLPQASDGLSIFINANKLYLGRENNTAIPGPELYQFDISNPAVSIPLIGEGEVGGDVTEIQVSNKYLYLGTNKNGGEFQVWNSDATVWNPAILNAGRYKAYGIGSTLPLQFDIDMDWIYVTNNNSGATDKIQILYTTP